MQRKDVLPDFFIVGVAKCGTTSLYTWLGQHSEIMMSKPKKEPVFFEAEFHNGMDYYRKKYFSGWDGEKLTGEANGRNLYVPHVPGRIHSVRPDARFIVLMRNPVDRAWAHWWNLYYRRGGKREKESLSFADAVRDNHERLQKGLGITTPEEIRAHEEKVFTSSIGVYRSYLDMGYYAEHIEHYMKFFSRDQFKLLLFDDLKSDPVALVREVCEFLGVDPSECERFDYTPKKVAKKMKWRRALVHTARNFSMDTARGVFKDGLGSIRERPPMDPEVKKWLIEHYRPHNERLEKILGRSLEHWNKP